MKPIILFRLPDRHYEKELLVAKQFFDVSTSRNNIPENSLVIGRYSVLPYYKELTEDLAYNGSMLINSYRQHRYIADLSNWYNDLADITPKTWFHLSEVSGDGPFVLKGETNSMKQNWKTHMFAENKAAVSQVHTRLLQDSLIGRQNIYIRQYVPFRTFELELGSGLPITEEYRFFVLNGQIVSSAFYWSSHYEVMESNKDINPDNVPREFIQDVIDRVGKNANFFVIDIARTAQPYQTMEGEKEWMVVELNDGSMSGLSENDPEILYGNMKKVLT